METGLSRSLVCVCVLFVLSETRSLALNYRYWTVSVPWCSGAEQKPAERRTRSAVLLEDLLLTVYFDPQRQSRLGQRLVQEQHAHHVVLGQRGQFPVRHRHWVKGHAARDAGQRFTCAHLYTARHVAGWLYSRSKTSGLSSLRYSCRFLHCNWTRSFII